MRMDCQSQRCSFSRRKESYKAYLLICLLAYLLASTPLMASTSPNASQYQAEAHRTFASIEIDGDFNEPDWQEAKPVGQFSQVEPDAG